MRRGNRRRVVFVVMDGARPDVLEQLLRRGDLPHLARHVLEGGSLRTGTTVFPSTTGPAYLPFLMGRYPGPAGVPGIRWLDRSLASGGLRDQWRAARSYCGVQAGWIDDDVRAGHTLFERVPSLAICSPVGRGLAEGEHLPTRRALLGSVAHFLPGAYALLDDAVARAWRSAIGRPWRFLFVVFPGVDGVMHLTDPFDPRVLDRYRAVDRALGAFVAQWRRSVTEPVPDLFVASDHGASAVAVHDDVALALERHGLPTVRHPVHVWRRGARAAVMVSGNGMANVYLDPRSGRSAPLTAEQIPADVVDLVASLPGVDLVAMRDGWGGVVVHTDAGCARLADVRGAVRHTPIVGDALGLGTAPGCFDDRALLALTMAGPRPDAPRQLLQLLASDRSGDLVLAARPGFDLRGPWELPEHRAGHGSLTREHMLVPILSSVPLPGVPLRTVDLMPTVLERLGLPLPADLDGMPLSRFVGSPAMVQAVPA